MTSAKQRSARRAVANHTNNTATFKLAGEIVSWTPSIAGTLSIKHVDMVRALRDASIDEKFARELLPRHAFARACAALSEGRIIDVIREDENFIYFQFTKHFLDADQWKFDRETTLSLNKQTGSIDCDIPDLATTAKAELDRCMEARTTADVTRIVQRIFEYGGEADPRKRSAENEADLFPIRAQGGAYFVDLRFQSLVNSVHSFLERLTGTRDAMTRFPVPTGTAEGDRALQRTVAEHIKGIIGDHDKAIDDFDIETSERTLTAQADRIKTTGYKIEAYAEYLKDESGKLRTVLDTAKKKLASYIDAMSAVNETSDLGVAECDHCKHPQPAALDATSHKCVACGKTFYFDDEPAESEPRTQRSGVSGRGKRQLV